MNKIKLAPEIINQEDINALINWLKTYPQLTKSKLTIEFEELFSKWLGTKHSVYVNSGSSANLLMIQAIKEYRKIKKLKTEKIVIPALSWATDLAPVMQLGLKPILCDCNLENLSLDLDHLEKIFKEQSPDVLLLVHVLGLAPDMNKINSLCELYNVTLLEDTCESMGSEYKDKKLGSFGLMSSFSFYWGHHISTIEGGMISTDNNTIYNILKSLRSHGWSRDLDEHYSLYLSDTCSDMGIEIDQFDNQFTFYYPGFNVRATDLQAFIGINQLKKINQITTKREKLFQYFNEFSPNKFYSPGNKISSFAWPFISKSKEHKKELATKLEKEGIECRPLICGSMGKQPFYVKEYGTLCLKNADIVSERGLYTPCHQEMEKEDVKRICDILKQ